MLRPSSLPQNLNRRCGFKPRPMLIAAVRDPKDWLNIFKGAGWAADSRYLNLNTIKSSGVPPVRISNELIRRLKLWSSLHGERPPILIIDEAHSFKRATDKYKLQNTRNKCMLCLLRPTLLLRDGYKNTSIP
ncbi:hypothetical protein PSTG_14713 [Puccinia striiformis f. sp. tritici PST-78]|uniref:Uncharacterized protein n=1 Tax=Puccinia striiformis f. sp. tritici PST-78 TaxID=1165861 RepID=A0A0L0UYM8_9BASI|nr:hypothetical protein PSTG_14713 [Puccinia striiformis f. sp. tritici PST-78]